MKNNWPLKGKVTKDNLLESWGGGLKDRGELPVAAGVFVATETGSGLVLALMEHGQKL